MNQDSDDTQIAQWDSLFEKVHQILDPLGSEDPFAKGDFFVLDDNWGTKELRVEVNNLALLEPAVVNSLRRILDEFSGWKIVVAVDIPHKGWPPMGLIIRRNEVVDGLQRQFLPSEFARFLYERSRPGTDKD
jgi:hypothetical protein